ncbi:P-loop containing nucleoside triphosphate hydrolase protein [Jimgerdemannia flammicorona]|uniref:P-loop containing nucleoside triphosphate hydrolase protein n=1 Tax=Jimgerdemannia flammicorona TaxID=994334 RepID=A0A433AWM2_9FUNG|nr:P-loop containing nucleoside triphosphate hydrolase protein [Jimgerdemannia flammicorona]
MNGCMANWKYLQNKPPNTQYGQQDRVAATANARDYTDFRDLNELGTMCDVEATFSIFQITLKFSTTILYSCTFLIINLKLVGVGNTGVGKTSLFCVGARGIFPDIFMPTCCDLTSDFVIEGMDVEIELCDTAGQADYDRLRPLAYPGSHVVLLCFAIDDRESFVQIADKWVPEINRFIPKVPKLLVCTKIDLRDDYTIVQADLITRGEGESFARTIGAQYFECSAMTGANVNEVMMAAGTAGLEVHMEKKGEEVLSRGSGCDCILL